MIKIYLNSKKYNKKENNVASTKENNLALGCLAQITMRKNENTCIEKFYDVILICIALVYQYFKTLLFYVYGGLPACMCVRHTHTWHPQRSKEGIGSSGAGVMGGCEPSVCDGNGVQVFSGAFNV